MNIRKHWLQWSLLLFVLNATAAVDAQQLPSDLDAYVARAMKTFDVPGLSIAVVKDGKVVLLKGYGIRKLGEPMRVTKIPSLVLVRTRKHSQRPPSRHSSTPASSTGMTQFTSG